MAPIPLFEDVSEEAMSEASTQAVKLLPSPFEVRISGALSQVESVLDSALELQCWDPDGCRLLRRACVELRDLLVARLDEIRAGDPPRNGSARPPRNDVTDALGRIRVLLDRLSLPKAAWEGWWETACRLKLLEARLAEDKGGETTAVA